MARSFLLTFFLISCCSFAQTGKLKGYVFDSITGECVPFADIHIRGTKFTTTTNIQGQFVFDSIPAGKYILSILYTGYSQYIRGIESEEDKNELLKCYLAKGVTLEAPEAIELPEVLDSIIIRKYYDRRNNLKYEEKTSYGTGNHRSVFRISKYNFKGLLTEKVYYSQVDTAADYRMTEQFKYDRHKRMITCKIYRNNKPLYERCFYYKQGELSKEIYKDLVRNYTETYNYAYKYDKDGKLILEEKMCNGTYIYSKKY